MTERHLFRGKRIGGTIDEWIVGLLTRTWPGDDYALIRPIKDREWQVRMSTVGQCTGLQDSDGEWIYEGDIVSFGGEIYIIKFDAACFWITQPDGYAMELHTILGQGNVRVVGNIHDQEKEHDQM